MLWEDITAPYLGKKISEKQHGEFKKLGKFSKKKLQ